MSEVRELIDTEIDTVDGRELTDTELDTVCGGISDLGKYITKAVDEALSAAIGVGGPAVAINVVGNQTNQTATL
jgi:hypothetical protein